MVVQSSPASPEQDAEFNKWYDDEHLPEMLSLAGFTAARRYRLRETATAAAPAHGYLTIYEVEADDLDAALAAMRARPRGATTDALSLDPPPLVLFYDLIAEATEPGWLPG
jgi:hypothetical protein